MTMIYTEATPNPNALKFMPDVPVTTGGTLDVRSIDQSNGIHLIEDLFGVPHVVGVYIGPDFVTITKDSEDWSDITNVVLGIIADNIRQPKNMPRILSQPIRKSSCKSRNCWIPACARQLPAMAAISCSETTRTA